MTATGIRVLDPGAQSTVQDCGRRGCAHLGVSPSGAADWFSAQAANRLAGNMPCTALIETTLTGIRLQTETDATVAVTGAAAPLKIEGREVALWTRHHAGAGAEISVGTARRGLRSYIAFCGGIAVPAVLGSASTDLGSGFGGLEGRALRAGDMLALGEPDAREPAAYPEESIPHWTSPARLRAVNGPHADMLGAAVLQGLCDRTFTVSSRSTRQGLRLDGEPLALSTPTDIASAGACAGCVQVTSGGLPVILLTEHQTTGGYAYALCVITADLPRAGQLRPGEQVQFEVVTLPDAAYALELAERRLAGERVATAGLARGFFEGI